MHAEPGEKRAFLPEFVGWLMRKHFQVFLEHGYGSGMGFSEADYLEQAPAARFVSWEQTYLQPYVLVLRYPGDQPVSWMHRNACLISMLHYPTRPERVQYLRALGLQAISLDSIKDDTGRRLVENLWAVAWNGAEVAFKVLREIYPPPGFENPQRPPIQVMLLGAGAVGMHAVQSAIHYGNAVYRKRLAAAGVPGVQVTVLDYDLTHDERLMQELLKRTDLLIDATQRPDPSHAVILNDWIGFMPQHAVLLDLSVDPYAPDSDPPAMKAIEGIPHGNLSQYVFAPDDPAFDLLPEGVKTVHRRHTVSCYSWPGIHPEVCMNIYGKQLQPLMRTLMDVGGVEKISPIGSFFERALSRALLSRWQAME